MPLQTTDYLLGPPRVTDRHVEALFANIDGPDAKDREFIDRLRYWCRVAGVDDANAISQFLWETDNARSVRWNRDLNPVGLGITSDGTIQPFDIKTVDEAARVTVQAIYAMVKKEWHPRVPMPASTSSWMNAVWLPKVRDPNYPKGVDQVKDQNIVYSGNRATWAVDDAYMGHVTRFNRLIPGVPDQGAVTEPPKEPPVSIPYPAPPLRISITPYGNANRPKLEMASPSYITVHEVGNTSPGADEEMHRRFVHNGGGPGQVSFHFVVGPTEAIQLIPLDEAAWHASDGYNGTGNRDSVAIETIQIGDFNRTLWNLAWLINEIATNPGRFNANKPRQWDFSINKIKQHHDWAPDGKNCPQFIRDRGLWNTLMSRVDAWNAAGKPQPKPDPKPEPEPEPEKPTMPKLPKGLSIQMVRRLYNPLGAKDPDTNSRAAFSEDDEAAVRWLRHGIAAIPKGGDWTDAVQHGGFGPLTAIVRRGDGSRLYQFVGFAHEVAPAKDAA